MHSFWGNVGDQTLHTAWSLGALTPLLLWPHNIFAGALAGLCIALPRELVDQWPIGHVGDTILDLAFFALGGALGVFLLT